jgi:hypothetical protein
MEVNRQLHAPAALLLRKELPYSSDMRHVGPITGVGLWGINHPSRSLNTILTELSRIH